MRRTCPCRSHSRAGKKSIFSPPQPLGELRQLSRRARGIPRERSQPLLSSRVPSIPLLPALPPSLSLSRLSLSLSFVLPGAHVAGDPAGNTEDICRKVVSAINKDEAAAIKCRARRSRLAFFPAIRFFPPPCRPAAAGNDAAPFYLDCPLVASLPPSLSLTLSFIPAVSLTPFSSRRLSPRHYRGPRALHRFILAPSNRRETRRATVKATPIATRTSPPPLRRYSDFRSSRLL